MNNLLLATKKNHPIQSRYIRDIQFFFRYSGFQFSLYVVKKYNLSIQHCLIRTPSHQLILVLDLIVIFCLLKRKKRERQSSGLKVTPIPHDIFLCFFCIAFGGYAYITTNSINCKLTLINRLIYKIIKRFLHQSIQQTFLYSKM